VFAANAQVRPSTNADLFAETKSVTDQLLGGNSYLRQQGDAKEAVLAGHKGLVTTYAGFSLATGDEEFVRVYTARTRAGSFFSFISVTPFSARLAYNRTFHLILDSLKF
jgi:hypothetical protein